MEEARDEGLRITADMYTYHASSTGLEHLLEDGLLLAALCQVHLLNNVGSRQQPDLVFLNCCHLARMEPLAERQPLDVCPLGVPVRGVPGLHGFAERGVRRPGPRQPPGVLALRPIRCPPGSPYGQG